MVDPNTSSAKKILKNLILGIKLEFLDLSNQMRDTELYDHENLYEPNGKNSFCIAGGSNVISLL